MHLLCRDETPDYAAWKRAFDGGAEARRDAGLGLLQLWREEGGAVWSLFEVSDRARAEAYLEGPGRLAGGVGTGARHFLETA